MKIARNKGMYKPTRTRLEHIRQDCLEEDCNNESKNWKCNVCNISNRHERHGKIRLEVLEKGL